MTIKEFFFKVTKYCKKTGKSLKTCDVIDVAVREFSDDIILYKFNNHELYYQSRWHISRFRKWI